MTRCLKCKKQEGYSIHGRCVACQFQMYPSKALQGRAKKIKA